MSLSTAKECLLVVTFRAPRVPPASVLIQLSTIRVVLLPLDECTASDSGWKITSELYVKRNSHSSVNSPKLTFFLSDAVRCEKQKQSDETNEERENCFCIKILAAVSGIII